MRAFSNSVTIEVPENVYPFMVAYSTSYYQGSGYDEITEEQYDSSNSSNKISFGNKTYIQLNLYKVDDTHCIYSFCISIIFTASHSCNTSASKSMFKRKDKQSQGLDSSGFLGVPRVLYLIQIG